MKRKLQLAIGVIFTLGAMYFLLPLAIGICHIGMLYPAAGFLFLSAVAFFPKHFRKLFHTKAKPIFIALSVAFLCVALLILITLGAMWRQCRNRPTNDDDLTVIVLGCEVNKTRPSVMLQARIDAAYTYLSSHPDTVCIASGGMDDEEQMTEAQCIRDTLVAMGIDSSRIYMEDASHSTRENISFCAQMIADNGLPTNIAIASDNFHQLRAALYAGEQQLRAYSLGCPSYWPLSPGYWTREVAGIWAYYILGH